MPVQSAEGNWKCVWIYQVTFVVKWDQVVDCSCRHCSQGNGDVPENRQQGRISEGQAPHQTCYLAKSQAKVLKNSLISSSNYYASNWMWNPGCPRREICLQWCWKWVPGWHGQASGLDIAVWAPFKEFDHTHPPQPPPPPPPTATTTRPVPLELGIKAIKLMKCVKAAGTSQIVAEMLKAAGV